MTIMAIYLRLKLRGVNQTDSINERILDLGVGSEAVPEGKPLHILAPVSNTVIK